MAKKPIADFDINDGTDEPDTEPVSQVTRVPKAEPAPAAASAAVTLSMEQFHMLLGALQHAGGNTQELAEAITQGVKEAREPIPENKITDEISDCNPIGDRPYPRHALPKCEFWMGVITDGESEADRRVIRFEELDATSLTIEELLALNTLEPGQKVIRRLDGARMEVRIEGTYHRATGALTELVIAYPAVVISKQSHENKNMVPPIVNMVRQVTGHNFERPDVVNEAYRERLRALYAEHRAGRYVSQPATVAA